MEENHFGQVIQKAFTKMPKRAIPHTKAKSQ